jgi:hypothetical protein
MKMLDALFGAAVGVAVGAGVDLPGRRLMYAALVDR